MSQELLSAKLEKVFHDTPLAHFRYICDYKIGPKLGGQELGYLSVSIIDVLKKIEETTEVPNEHGGRLSKFLDLFLESDSKKFPQTIKSKDDLVQFRDELFALIVEIAEEIGKKKPTVEGETLSAKRDKKLESIRNKELEKLKEVVEDVAKDPKKEEAIRRYLIKIVNNPAWGFPLNISGEIYWEKEIADEIMKIIPSNFKPNSQSFEDIKKIIKKKRELAISQEKTLDEKKQFKSTEALNLGKWALFFAEKEGNKIPKKMYKQLASSDSQYLFNNQKHKDSYVMRSLSRFRATSIAKQIGHIFASNNDAIVEQVNTDYMGCFFLLQEPLDVIESKIDDSFQEKYMHLKEGLLNDHQSSPLQLLDLIKHIDKLEDKQDYTSLKDHLLSLPREHCQTSEVTVDKYSYFSAKRHLIGKLDVVVGVNEKFKELGKLVLCENKEKLHDALEKYMDTDGDLEPLKKALSKISDDLPSDKDIHINDITEKMKRFNASQKKAIRKALGKFVEDQKIEGLQEASISSLLLGNFDQFGSNFQNIGYVEENGKKKVYVIDCGKQEKLKSITSLWSDNSSYNKVGNVLTQQYLESVTSEEGVKELASQVKVAFEAARLSKEQLLSSIETAKKLVGYRGNFSKWMEHLNVAEENKKKCKFAFNQIKRNMSNTKNVTVSLFESVFNFFPRLGTFGLQHFNSTESNPRIEKSLEYVRKGKAYVYDYFGKGVPNPIKAKHHALKKQLDKASELESTMEHNFNKLIEYAVLSENNLLKKELEELQKELFSLEGQTSYDHHVTSDLSASHNCVSFEIQDLPNEDSAESQKSDSISTQAIMAASSKRKILKANSSLVPTPRMFRQDREDKTKKHQENSKEFPIRDDQDVREMTEYLKDIKSTCTVTKATVDFHINSEESKELFIKTIKSILDQGVSPKSITAGKIQCESFYEKQINTEINECLMRKGESIESYDFKIQENTFSLNMLTPKPRFFS